MNDTNIVREIERRQETIPTQAAEFRIFHSLRKHPIFPIGRLDNNLFFPASVCFLLRQYLDQMSGEAASISRELLKNSKALCHRYENRDKGPVYNFWPLGRHEHFPNGRMLHRFSHFKLPEDLDTTALVHLAFPDLLNYDEKVQLKEYLASHTNGRKGTVIDPLPGHRRFRAYSTWIGEKMPVEFDVCALSNFLLWVKRNGLTWNEFDSDSLALIRDVIDKGSYRERTFQSAPYYPDPAVQLYHLARLFAQLEDKSTIKKLTAAIRKQLAGEHIPIRRMILESSLIKLGGTPDLPASYSADEILLDKLSWFRAGFLTIYRNWLAGRLLARWPLFEMRYYCEAFQWALLLEHVLLVKKLP